MIKPVVIAIIALVLELNAYPALSASMTQRVNTSSYLLIKTPEGQEIIRSAGGDEFPVVTWEMHGLLANVAVENDVAIFHGWSADIQNNLFPEAIQVFVNGRYFYSGKTEYPQRWLVERTDNHALSDSGFIFKFPLEEFEDFDDSEIRFFSIWKNKGARELKYYDKTAKVPYKWIRKSHKEAGSSGVNEESLPYTLVIAPEKGEVIRTQEGKTFPIRTGAMIARLGLPQVKKNLVEFYGWAADVELGGCPKAILIFLNGKLFHEGKTGHMTPWLIEKYGNPKLAEAGYSFKFPLQEFKDLDGSEIRFFSLWENGVVTEVEYHKDYQWGPKAKRALI